jgi:hypothetical protein
MNMGDIAGWVQVALGVLGLAVIPVIGWRVKIRRTRHAAEAEACSARAAAQEQARRNRRAIMTATYEPPEPGSNKFGALVLVNSGLASARNIKWRTAEDGRQGNPVVITEGSAGVDPYQLEELPPGERFPVASVARPLGRRERLSIALEWTDFEGYHQDTVTILIPYL